MVPGIYLTVKGFTTSGLERLGLARPAVPVAGKVAA
jgi:hypothetical protein